MKNTRLICPICHQKLHKIDSEKTYRCEAKHSFDIAKQGYVNLLPVSEKSSKSPGDSKEMVLARREFLAKDFYKSVSDALNQVIVSTLSQSSNTLGKSQSNPLQILDLGCGEGYYTGRLLSDLQSKGLNVNLYGLDISKDAVKYAAGAVKGVIWMVGNSHHIPLEDHALDGIFSVFSPIKAEECARVLKPKGLFYRVLPGIHHLIEMRELIYKKVILNEDARYDTDEGGLIYQSTIDVTYQIKLTNEELLSLVKMTPHYWHTSKEDKAALDDVTELDVTIDMKILIYQHT